MFPNNIRTRCEIGFIYSVNRIRLYMNLKFYRVFIIKLCTNMFTFSDNVKFKMLYILNTCLAAVLSIWSIVYIWTLLEVVPLTTTGCTEFTTWKIRINELQADILKKMYVKLSKRYCICCVCLCVFVCVRIYLYMDVFELILTLMTSKYR